MRILVTGGAGFIGSALIRHLIRTTDARVINLDKLTYAANPDALEEAALSPRYVFEEADICDVAALKRIFAQHKPTAVMHLAAESHVDRSIDAPGQFIDTNVVGTFRLLDTALRYWTELEGTARKAFRFHHISTDEVYGTLDTKAPAFTEMSPYRPNSPYAASKAASDHLVRAWSETYHLPIILTNCSNNFGPWQFPEKLIPLTISKAILGEKLPVYGQGENVRDWLFVEDHAAALLAVLTRAEPGCCYNIGGKSERRNIDVVRQICRLLDERLAPSPGRQPHEALITFVTDRPGHDFRYAIDTTLIETELGWQPAQSFESGLARTVDWYIENRGWWETLRQSRYAGERLGHAAKTG